MSQKQIISNPDLQNPTPFSKNEKIELLEKRIAELNKICNEINPYQELPEEMKALLRKYGILEFTNPFHITNTLVLLLEDAIDELHHIRPFEINEF